MSEKPVTGTVVDTDVVSFLFKGDTSAEGYRPFVEGSDRLVICFMTVAELERWALQRKWGAKQRAAMDVFIRDRFLVHNDMTQELCRTWASITHEVRARGRDISCADAWVAATALVLGLALLTHNRRDFESVAGLVVLPPKADVSEAPGLDPPRHREP